MTFALLYIAGAGGCAKSLPAISGAAIAQNQKSPSPSSVRYPLPTSSMSGSFQAPGPAYATRTTLLLELPSMVRRSA